MTAATVCILCACAYLIADGTEAFDIIGERITGEYNGRASMRCSLVPTTLQIQVIEWRKGSRPFDPPVYIASQRYPPKDIRRGSFKGRNITGSFSRDFNTYDLSISLATPSDFANYSCHIKPRDLIAYKYRFIELTLVAPPAVPPFIIDMSGTIQRTSNCSNLDAIPVITVDNDMSFVCQVGPTKPYPTVDWKYDGHSLVHNISFSDNNDTGILKKGAKRQIDAIFSRNATLMCIAKVPSARTGRLEDVYMCLQLEYNNNGEVIVVLIIPLGALVMVGCLLLYIYLCCKMKQENINDIEQKVANMYLSVIQAGLLGAAVNLLMGLLVVVCAFTQCSGRIVADGHVESYKRGSPTIIGTLVYLCVRLALDIGGVTAVFCMHKRQTKNPPLCLKGVFLVIIIFIGPSAHLVLAKKKQRCRTNDTQLPLLIIFGFDITVAVTYWVGFYSGYTTAGYFWHEGAIVCLASIVFLLCLTFLALVIIKVSSHRVHNKYYLEELQFHSQACKEVSSQGAYQTSREQLQLISETCVEDFCKDLGTLGCILVHPGFARKLCKSKRAQTYLEDLGWTVWEMGQELPLQDVAGIDKLTQVFKAFLQRMWANNSTIEPIYSLESEERRYMHNESSLQELLDQYMEKLHYPPQNDAPKWVTWGVSSIMDHLAQCIKWSNSSLEEKESRTPMLQREIWLRWAQHLEAIKTLLDKEKERWDPEFSNMVNPAAVAWGLSVSATVVWTKEQLRQRINVLDGITTLDLRDCGLTEIPENVYTLDELQEINVLDLSGNFICTIPKRLSCIKLLRHLRLCFNHVREIEIGALGERLEVITLEHNRLKSLPTDISSCLQLQILNLAWNNMERLPPVLPALEVLDVQGNNTLGAHSSSVAAESGMHAVDHKTGYDKLLIFYGSHCGYTEIPKSILASPRVKCIMMTNNRIKALSPDIGQMSELVELNIESNNIKELPKELLICSALQNINVQKNPLNIPEEVKSQGVEAIMNYLKESKNASMVNMRFRVPMLGDTGAGKSSFVDSLIAGSSELTHKDDRTYVIEHKQWRPQSKRYPGEMLQIQFDDFGGHECYKQVHIFFLSRKCTPVICVRVDKLNKETFDDVVTPWLETTTSAIPNATFHLVITHTDRLLDKTALESKKEMMLERVKQREQSVIAQLKQQLDRVEKDIKICRDYEALHTMKEERDALKKFLSQRPEVPNKIHAVSAHEIQSVKVAGQEIVNIFEDVVKYPEEKIPNAWKIFQKKIKTEPGVARYVTWTRILRLGKDCDLNEESVSYALRYLHLCGDILWYDDGPMLKDIIFHDPNKLVELIRTLITHDIKDIKKDEEKFSSLTDDEFAKEKERMLTKGLISMRLLGCLWNDFRLTENETDFLKELLLRFDLCFAIPRADNVFHAKQAVDLMFPWLLPEERSHDIFDKPAGGKKEIGIRMCFEGLCPPSFFPALAVRLNKFVKKEGGSRQDWRTGVFGEDESGNMFLLERTCRYGRDTLLLKVRGAELDAMWHLALPIQREMQDLLHKWPGVISNYYVPCPKCPIEEKQPCNFTAEYLWRAYPGQVVPRCPKTFQYVDKLLLYPSKQVLEGIHPPSKQVSKGKGHTNYQKLWTLLDIHGAEMLREILQAAIQPLILNQWLLSYQPYVHRILKKRPLKIYGRLYPLSVRAVELYDLSCDILLDLLMGDLFKGLEQHKATFEDFKRVYDNLNDRSTDTLSDEIFEQLWKKAETAIVHLGGNEEKIAELKHR